MHARHLFCRCVVAVGALLLTMHAGKVVTPSGAYQYRDRSSYEVLCDIIVAHNAMLASRCPTNLTLVNAACFMQEYGYALPALFVPAARYVSDHPVGACTQAPCFVVLARQAGTTNLLRTTITVNHNAGGMIAALTADRPLRLADGVLQPASTPVPIELVLRALACHRATLPPPAPDLTIQRSVRKISYGHPHVAKVKTTCLLRGRLPSTLPDFDCVSQFVITPLPLLTTSDIAHVLQRRPEGTQGGKHPRYTHLFVYSNATEQTPPFGLFMARLQNNTLHFIYKFKVDNRNTNIFSVVEFNYMRSLMASNAPSRTLEFAHYHVDVDSAAHTASNVPCLLRVSKAGITLSNVKPPKSN
jgi:hypothetical protein